jgi:hypothetical protein
MFVVQATLTTIVNYDPNTFIVKSTVSKLYFDLLNILHQKDFIRSGRGLNFLIEKVNENKDFASSTFILIKIKRC